MSKKKKEQKKVNKELQQQYLKELKALQTEYKDNIQSIVSELGENFVATKILSAEFHVEITNNDNMNPEGLEFIVSLKDKDSETPILQSYINPRGIIEPIKDRRHAEIMTGYGDFVNSVERLKTVEKLMIDIYKTERDILKKVAEC